MAMCPSGSGYKKSANHRRRCVDSRKALDLAENPIRVPPVRISRSQEVNLSSSAQTVSPPSSCSSIRWLKALVLAIVLLIAVVFVLRYVFHYYLHYNEATFTDPVIGAANYWRMRGWLLLHITSGMVAILTGPWSSFRDACGSGTFSCTASPDASTSSQSCAAARLHSASPPGRPLGRRGDLAWPASHLRGPPPRRWLTMRCAKGRFSFTRSG